MKYVHVYELFLNPAATQIILGEQIRWVFASPTCYFPLIINQNVLL